MGVTSSTKHLSNLELSEILRDIAAVYQIMNDQKYRFQRIAYERAADGIEKLSSQVKDYFDEGKLTEIPGVGKNIAEHLTELFSEGHSKHFDEMLSKYPRSVFELMKVQGIGPKKAYRLVSELKVGTKNPLSDVLALASENRIANLEGFGAESQKDIVSGIQEYLAKPPERILLSTASEIAEKIMDWLKQVASIEKIDTLGSLRRWASTVGDIDISVASHDSTSVFDRLAKFPGILKVIERGEHSSSILLPPNIQVDVMIQPAESYGSLLQHFTGSKHHNIELREFALKKGLSLSEYGVKREKNSLDIQKFSDEKAFYGALGLPLIPPELREGRGEIQAAKEGKLPALVELSRVKGDLQIHSDFDIETSHDIGQSSMETIAQAAIAIGYEYIAFTEHNPSQKGHTEKRTAELLKRKSEKVAKLNLELVKSVKRQFGNKRVFKVFNALEIDILPNGNLAISDNALELLDFALVSIHSSFKQEKGYTTNRVIEALSHPNVRIFAHPTARIINKREGINLDWDAIFEFCVKHDKWIEINADPNRLDLPDALVKDAVKAGVKLTLGTDSHHVSGLANMKYGISVARRGWAERGNIVNTLALEAFEKLLL